MTNPILLKSDCECKPTAISTQWARVREFLADVRELGRPEGGVAVILDACGLNEWLLKRLAEYGYPLYVHYLKQAVLIALHKPA